MGQRIGGVATFKIDGNQYALRGNLQVSPSAVKREGIGGQDYVHGFLEDVIVPGIKGDFSTVPGLSLETIEAMTNQTIQADLANGSTYILQQAWTKASFQIDAAKGQLEIAWEGITCDELTGSS